MLDLLYNSEISNYKTEMLIVQMILAIKVWYYNTIHWWITKPFKLTNGGINRFA